MAEKYLVHTDHTDVVLEYDVDDDGVLVRQEGDERWRRASLDRIGDSELYLLMVDNEPTELYLERRRGGVMVTVGRHKFDYTVERWRPALENRQRAGEAQSGVHKILAPMTGSVVEVMTEEGARVANGDVVMVIESMKMNNEMRAPADGVVTSVTVKAGDRVSAGVPMVVIQADEAS